MLTLDKKIVSTFLKEIKEVKIGIVGDLMLDIFSYGEIERMSPEANVPIIDLKVKDFIPGGAANVARNITSLGSKAVLFSAVGTDTNGQLLEKILKKNKIETNSIIKIKRPTTVKERIIENGKHFVRIDTENKEMISKKEETALIQNFKKKASTLNVLIFSDYAKGIITERIVTEFCKIAVKRNIPIIVDTKPKNAVFFCKKNISLFTPNAKEALEISNKKNFETAAFFLQEYFSSAILITKGSQGMTLYEKNTTTHLEALSSNVVDVSGCGDTVAAVLSVSLAVKKTKREAISFANHAAGIVVQKKGTSTISRKEFLEFCTK